MSSRAVVAGVFDDLRCPAVRFLQEASRYGELHAALLSDEAVVAARGTAPAFPLEERRYLLTNLRYVASVGVLPGPLGAGQVPLASDGRVPDAWVEIGGAETPGAPAACAARSVRHVVLDPRGLAAVPEGDPVSDLPRPVALVTGCFDWLHSGHVRFFEECSAFGSLVVVVGSDANVRHLKGEGHPLFPESARRYLVGSIRTVSLALVSTGRGWLDAEPEINAIRPDRYIVNGDGDRPEKRTFCEARGIEYIVRERTPRPGLARRSGTDLRGY